MRTKQRNSQCRVPRASLLLTLTTVILFSCSQQSLAQQRDGDATNADSNTSNTAANRSAVNFNFNFANLTLLNGEFLEAFGANNSRGILRGHPTIPGTELGSTTADPLIFSTNSTERMRILANGFVGIGTTSPNAKLHVVGVAPWGTAAFMGTTWVSVFNYNADQSEDTYIRGGKANSRVLINDGHSGNVLMALNGGNVGIGTLTPTAKLHVQGNGRVSGNLTVDGNIAAKYQDMAEWVPAAEQLSAGIVVVLDTTKPNHVISSSTSYDARIAGVISAQPGIVLGEKSDNKVLVATTGRVRVKVTATNGPIHIGDLLVTSNSEGFAMKSLPIDVGGVRIHRPGTLIGKALEPLTSGTGEILVLLSLQ